jgi:hypothetical protein
VPIFRNGETTGIELLRSTGAIAISAVLTAAATVALLPPVEMSLGRRHSVDCLRRQSQVPRSVT